jgi:hypothetical protein
VKSHVNLHCGRESDVIVISLVRRKEISLVLDFDISFIAKKISHRDITFGVFRIIATTKVISQNVVALFSQVISL